MSFSETPPSSEPEAQPSTELSSDDKQWGMFAHLAALVAMAAGGMAFLGPLIVWMIKKDQSKFVDDQGKEALNFQITMLIALLISGFTVLVMVGIALVPAVVLVNVIFSILGGVEANKGKLYRYPFNIRFIK